MSGNDFSHIIQWALPLADARAVHMNQVVGLVVFAFVAAITPGPNNVMLWASGVQFGTRRTLPHIVGIVLGVGSMVILAATGLGALIEAVPPIEIALKIIGSLYLLYLALRISGMTRANEANVAAPLTPVQALIFQYVNPKAWVFVLGATAAFRPADMPVFLGALLMAAVIMVVVVPSTLVWTASGTVLNRLFGDRSSGRGVNVALALLLVATVVFIWK